MKEIGNDNANQFWEYNLPKQDKIEPKATE